jgi:hypothetical protein
MTSALQGERGFKLCGVVKPLAFFFRHLVLLALCPLFGRQATRKSDILYRIVTWALSKIGSLTPHLGSLKNWLSHLSDILYRILTLALSKIGSLTSHLGSLKNWLSHLSHRSQVRACLIIFQKLVSKLSVCIVIHICNIRSHH